MLLSRRIDKSVIHDVASNIIIQQILNCRRSNKTNNNRVWKIEKNRNII